MTSNIDVRPARAGSTHAVHGMTQGGFGPLVHIHIMRVTLWRLSGLEYAAIG
ncbi:hypothetical protein ACFONI_04280 [Aeromonas media]|uniref:hypothetical protein n=1 Tax=Aeromonas media TaxID=651 RepID=UPI003614B87B